MIGLTEDQVSLVIQNVVSLIVKRKGAADEEVAESDITMELFNDALAKSTADGKSLTKVSSVGKLPSAGLIPKKKAALQQQHKFTYAIISGNNSSLLKRVLQQSSRSYFWEDNTHLYMRQPVP